MKFSSILIILTLSQVRLFDENTLEETAKEAINENEDLEKVGEMNQDQLDEITQKLQYMSNIGCYLAVQREIQVNQEDLQKISQNSNADIILKNFIGTVYNTCLEKVSRDEQTKLWGAFTIEDYKNLNVQSLRNLPFKEMIFSENLELSPEIEESFKEYTEMEQNMKDMRDKFEENKPKKFDEADKSERKNVFKNKKPEIIFMGFNLNDISSSVWFLLLVLLLGGPFILLWKKLFKEPEKKSKKKKNKRKSK